MFKRICVLLLLADISFSCVWIQQFHCFTYEYFCMRWPSPRIRYMFFELFSSLYHSLLCGALCWRGMHTKLIFFVPFSCFYKSDSKILWQINETAAIHLAKNRFLKWKWIWIEANVMKLHKFSPVYFYFIFLFDNKKRRKIASRMKKCSHTQTKWYLQ